VFLKSEIKYSEDELVVLLQQRNQEAFSYLYDNYAGALNATIIKMIDDKALAEDILQEAFVKIWNNFLSYDKSKGRLFTWMINLTKNLTIDTIRSKGYKKQMKILKDENSVIEIKDSSTGIDKYDAMGIRKQLFILKPDLRTIIDLAYFGGYTQDEISKNLNIPIGTVKTRMRAALIELRKNIQQ
jgi:RNA polymerase sigma factor (sigma-70 family)